MARAAMPDGAAGRAFGSSKKGMSSEKPDIAPNVVIRQRKARSVSVLFSFVSAIAGRRANIAAPAPDYAFKSPSVSPYRAAARIRSPILSAT
ncbi:hypothetical protein GCM10007880_42630 [Mesorhizobium amorphae]|nr:hypothetical protein GCM10007880_42630 [Mesorhizobium amorphae]